MRIMRFYHPNRVKRHTGNLTGASQLPAAPKQHWMIIQMAVCQLGLTSRLTKSLDGGCSWPTEWCTWWLRLCRVRAGRPGRSPDISPINSLEDARLLVAHISHSTHRYLYQNFARLQWVRLAIWMIIQSTLTIVSSTLSHRGCVEPDD